MKKKVYTISISNGVDTIESEVTSYSIHKLVDKFIENEYETLLLTFKSKPIMGRQKKIE